MAHEVSPRPVVDEHIYARGPFHHHSLQHPGDTNVHNTSALLRCGNTEGYSTGTFTKDQGGGCLTKATKLPLRLTQLGRQAIISRPCKSCSTILFDSGSMVSSRRHTTRVCSLITRHAFPGPNIIWRTNCRPSMVVHPTWSDHD
jgi:hypothetical protein